MKETEVQLRRNDTNPLTRYQMEKLNLAAMGLSNKEIAEKVCATEYSVGNSFLSISKKLGVKSKLEALILGINSGWLDPEQCVGQSNLSLFETLTSRQLDVVKLVVMGKTNLEIGVELSFSTSSISNYLIAVYSHLEIKPGENSNKRERAAVLYLAYRRRNNAMIQQPTS